MSLSSKEQPHKLLHHYKKAAPFGKADIVLLAAILVIVIVSVVVWYAGKPVGEKAEVYINGKLKATYSLSQDKTVSLDEIGVQLTIADGKIGVSDSDCKDKICMHSGYISHSGQRIVCAPNKLVVLIRGKQQQYDATTGRRRNG